MPKDNFFSGALKTAGASLGAAHQQQQVDVAQQKKDDLQMFMQMQAEQDMAMKQQRHKQAMLLGTAQLDRVSAEAKKINDEAYDRANPEAKVQREIDEKRMLDNAAMEDFSNRYAPMGEFGPLRPQVAFETGLEQFQSQLPEGASFKFDELGIPGQVSVPSQLEIDATKARIVASKATASSKGQGTVKTLSAEKKQLKDNIFKNYPKDFAEKLWDNSLNERDERQSFKDYDKVIKQLSGGNPFSNTEPTIEQKVNASRESGYSPEYRDDLTGYKRRIYDAYRAGTLARDGVLVDTQSKLRREIKTATLYFKNLKSNTLDFFEGN